MKKRRIILLLAAAILIIVWSSMTNGAEDLLEEIFPSIEESSGEIIQPEEIFTGEIPIETGQLLTGMDSGGVAASWLEFTGYDNLPLSGESDGFELSTWGFELSTQPRLIISEVYFDGTDEWIEITNIGDGDFQGNITLVGVKSTALSLVNISVLSGESKLFGDNIIQISGSQFIAKTGLSLNLIDTSPIHIQLSISGQVEDSFLVDSYRVNLYNDKKTSFEKVGWVSTRTTSGRIINALSGYTINPGRYFGSGTVSDVSFPLAQSSGDLQLPIPCMLVDQSNLLKVTEIFPGNENYPPYIELAIYDDINLNSLSISGSILATGVTFSRGNWGTTLPKNSILLLSSTGFWQDQEQLPSVAHSDFLLVSTWNRLLITIGYWQIRQVMDIVYYSGEMLGSSIYFNNSTLQCARVLDSIDVFSPGFERKFLKYISGRTAPIIEYVSVVTGNQTTGTTCPSLSTGGIFSWENQGTNWDLVTWKYSIKIVDVIYDPEGSDTDNETITLLATNNSGDTSPLDLSKIFRLKVNGTNKTLPRTLPMNIPTKFKKTFGFPNSTKSWNDVIIQLTYGDYIFDTYTYNPNIPKKEELLTGEILFTWTVYDLSWLQFSITYVLPNPIGKDIKEEIWILMTGYTSLTGFDLSQGFTLRRGSTKKKLSGFVIESQENIISGNLGLVNKAACVSLFYQEEELTKFCYRTPKEGEKIYASDRGLASLAPQDLSIMTSLQLKKINNTLCIRYEGQSYLCKKIPSSKAAFKVTQEQKLYKGFSSLIKGYLINDWQPLYYDTDIKQYFDLLAENKKLIAAGISQIDIYGQSVAVTNIKQQLQVRQNTPPAIIAIFEGMNVLKTKKTD